MNPSGFNSTPFGSTPPASGFGSSSPFGAASGSSLFGAPAGTTAPSWGGAMNTNTGTFGATSGPTPFGGIFGASSSPSFGGGLASAGNQGAITSPFGTSTGMTGAFGTATPAPGGSVFGNAFGAQNQTGTPFGGGNQSGSPFGGMGQTGSPFGAVAQPASPFGGGVQSSTPFGGGSQVSNPFGGGVHTGAISVGGQAASPFGGGGQMSSSFGGGSQFGTTFGAGASSGRPRGTRAVPFRPHNDSSGGANVRVQHICAMEEYKDRSPEELRWEDYQLGDFGGPVGPSQGSSGFGSPQSQSAFGVSSSGAFGTASFGAGSSPGFGVTQSTFGSTVAPASPFGATTSAIGATSGFGASQPPFGTQSTPSVFGGLSAPQTGFGSPAGGSTAFGAPGLGASATPGFGASATPGFGASATPGFGASATPGFGASATPGFGATTTPGFGASATPGFGASATPGFGASATPGFGATAGPGFGASSTPGFGASSTPGFGAPSAPSFGAAPSSGSGFGASGFGSSFATGSAFGVGASTGSAFGGGLSAASGFGAGATTSSAFGIGPSTGSAFGSGVSTGSAFGAGPSTGSIFGAGPSTGSAFGFGPSSGSAFGGISAAPTPTGGSSFGMPQTQLAGLTTTAPIFGGGSGFGMGGTGAFGTTQSAQVSTFPTIEGGALSLGQQASQNSLQLSLMPTQQQQSAVRETFSFPVERKKTSTHLTKPIPMVAQLYADENDDDFSSQMGLIEARNVLSQLDVTEEPNLTKSEEYLLFLERSQALPYFTLKGFYVVPSRSELEEILLSNPSGPLEIEGFLVGREGLATIQFEGKTSVEGLKLDDIVEIEKGSVTLYEKNGVEKPPIGKGLNKEAIITLFHVQSIVRGYEGKDELESYVERLRAKVKSIGGEFIDFDPEADAVRFRVKHFSGYSLLSPDRAEEITENRELVSQPTEEISKTLFEDVGIRSSQNLSVVQQIPIAMDLDPQELLSQRETFFYERQQQRQRIEESPAWDFQIPQTYSSSLIEAGTLFGSHSTPFSGELENIEMNANQSPENGLFGSQSTPAQRKALNFGEEDTPLSPIDLMFRNNAAAVARERGETYQVSSPEKEDRNIGEIVPFSADDVEIPVKNQEHSKEIEGFPLRRQYFVALGRKGEMVFPPKKKGRVTKLRSKKIGSPNVDSANDPLKKEMFHTLFYVPLDFLFDLSKAEAENHDSDGYFKLKRTLNIDRSSNLDKVCLKYMRIIDQVIQSPSLPTRAVSSLKSHKNTFELVEILFSKRTFTPRHCQIADLPNSKDAEMAPSSLLVQKAKFSRWLEKVLEKDNPDYSPELGCLSAEYGEDRRHSFTHETQFLTEILRYLMVRDLENASELAIDNGDELLAAMIQEFGGKTGNKADLSEQVAKWLKEEESGEEESDRWQNVGRERLAIYAMLSGNIDLALTVGGIGATDWRVYLGLLTWYALPPSSSVAFILSEFQHRVEEGRILIPRPEDDSYDGAKQLAGCEFPSVDYGVMMAFLEDQRNETTFSQVQKVQKWFQMDMMGSNLFDPCLSWHLLAILHAIGVLGPEPFISLTEGFANQLLIAGYPQFSVFVLLLNPEPFSGFHETTVRKYLSLGCPEWSQSPEMINFLHKKLEIPLVWIESELADFNLASRNYLSALKSLQLSLRWEDFFDLILQNFALHWINEGNGSVLGSHLQLCEQNSSGIPLWSKYGKVLLTGLQIMENVLVPNNEEYMVEAITQSIENCKEFLKNAKTILLEERDFFSQGIRDVLQKLVLDMCNYMSSSSKSDFMSKADVFEVHNVIMDAPLPEEVKTSLLPDTISSYFSMVDSEANY